MNIAPPMSRCPKPGTASFLLCLLCAVLKNGDQISVCVYMNIFTAFPSMFLCSYVSLQLTGLRIIVCQFFDCLIIRLKCFCICYFLNQVMQHAYHLFPTADKTGTTSPGYTKCYPSTQGLHRSGRRNSGLLADFSDIP